MAGTRSVRPEVSDIVQLLQQLMEAAGPLGGSAMGDPHTRALFLYSSLMGITHSWLFSLKAQQQAFTAQLLASFRHA